MWRRSPSKTENEAKMVDALLVVAGGAFVVEETGDAFEEEADDAGDEETGVAAEEEAGDAGDEETGDAAEEEADDAGDEETGDAAEEEAGDAGDEDDCDDARAKITAKTHSCFIAIF